MIAVARTKNTALVAACGVCLLAMIGCRPATMASVTGTVTSQGKPVPDAVVQFVAQKGPGAAGRTDADGRFSLSTLSPGDGAFFGMFKVAIEPFVPGMDPDAPAPSPLSPPKPVAQREDIPNVYRSVATTPLSAEVKRGAKNTFDFDLSNAPARSK